MSPRAFPLFFVPPDIWQKPAPCAVNGKSFWVGDLGRMGHAGLWVEPDGDDVSPGGKDPVEEPKGETSIDTDAATQMSVTTNEDDADQEWMTETDIACPA